MSRVLLAVAVLVAVAPPGAGQPARDASGPQVEISGRITKVGLARAQGMPSLEVKTRDGRTWRVWLGSMRYLIEQGFNPKTGQELSAKGFRKPEADELTAASVTLTETGQTVRLRDASGMPLWRGGRRGQR